MKFEEMSVKEYQDILSSKKSIPGGGSALALVLQTAISLCKMTVNFTLCKVGYEKVQVEMAKVNEQLDELTPIAYSLYNRDSESFLKLMEAYKTKDAALISEASIEACEVPFELYLATEQVQKLAQICIAKGNKNVVSDAKIAQDLCMSIYNGCILNVKANIKCIQDEVAVNKFKTIL